MSFIIGPYTVTRGATIPYKRKSQTDQNAEIDGDGGVVVTEVPYSVRFIKAKIIGSNEEIEAIKGFIESGVRFRAVPFYITDDWNVTHLVRYWGGEVESDFIAPGICEAELLFRKEV